MDTLCYCAKRFLLNKTKKKVRHYHDNCFELINLVCFLVLDLLSRGLKAKERKQKFNCEETNSKNKEEEEENPKQN